MFRLALLLNPNYGMLRRAVGVKVILRFDERSSESYIGSGGFFSGKVLEIVQEFGI